MLEVEAVNFKIKKPNSATWFQVLLQPPSPQSAGGIWYSHFPVWESVNLPLCEAV